MPNDVSTARMATLDDVLHGASGDDVRAVQKAILDYGGSLGDPAWVPFAAALRMRREVERIVPAAVLTSTSAASEAASVTFREAVSDVAQRVLSDVAERAATAPSEAAARAVAWRAGARLAALACTGGVLLGAALLAGALYFGVLPPPGLSAEDGARLDWASRFDDPVARAAAEWAVEMRVADPRLRVAAEWAITHQMDQPGRQSTAEWALTAVGAFAQRYFAENAFLANGECPLASKDMRTGRTTCVVWHVRP